MNSTNFMNVFRDHTTVELELERLLDAILLMLITRHVSMLGFTLVVSTEKSCPVRYIELVSSERVTLLYVY